MKLLLWKQSRGTFWMVQLMVRVYKVWLILLSSRNNKGIHSNVVPNSSAKVWVELKCGTVCWWQGHGVEVFISLMASIQNIPSTVCVYVERVLVLYLIVSCQASSRNVCMLREYWCCILLCPVRLPPGMRNAPWYTTTSLRKHLNVARLSLHQ